MFSYFFCDYLSFLSYFTFQHQYQHMQGLTQFFIIYLCCHNTTNLDFKVFCLWHIIYFYFYLRSVFKYFCLFDNWYLDWRCSSSYYDLAHTVREIFVICLFTSMKFFSFAYYDTRMWLSVSDWICFIWASVNFVFNWGERPPCNLIFATMSYWDKVWNY